MISQRSATYFCRLRLVAMRLLVGLACVAVNDAAARAGGGPENLFLVVNPRSYESLTIANHYQAWRGIAGANVFYLPWEGTTEITDLASFREKILLPIFTEIGNRKLDQQIDYVVYSAGYPYGVTIREKREGEMAEPVASLTSATYLYNLAIQNSPQLEGLQSNYYMRQPDSRLGDEPLGFSSAYRFDLLGRRVQARSGRAYMLSAMLGHTGNRGNTLTEILTYLRSAISADGSRPAGTIYFVRNDDRRSTARHDVFDEAAAAVRRAGIEAEVLTGVLPSNKRDVAGLCSGAANFSWADSGSSLLPGAFCDNLTSFGGVLAGGRGQTQLSEFLRFGAAGACGTVAEPTVHNKLQINGRPVEYQLKFPHPLVHAYYVSGCSLAEAFYQSIMGPYQQLLVGDPLCQPWAVPAEVHVAGLDVSQPVSGSVDLAPSAVSLRAPVDHFEFFVDGIQLASCRDGESISLDSTKLGDGVHELRVASIEASPLETQGHASALFRVDNQGRTIQLQRVDGGGVLTKEAFAVEVEAPNSSEILLYLNREIVGKIAGDKGALTIDPAKYGGGPLTFRALGLAENADQRPVFSEPMIVESEIALRQPVGGIP